MVTNKNNCIGFSKVEKNVNMLNKAFYIIDYIIYFHFISIIENSNQIPFCTSKNDLYTAR